MSSKPGRNVRKVYFTSVSIVKHVLLVSGVFVLIMVSFKPFGLGKMEFQFFTIIVAKANNEIRIATPLLYGRKKYCLCTEHLILSQNKHIQLIPFFL